MSTSEPYAEGSRYDPHADPPDHFRMQCRDCGEVWTFPNTESGWKEMWDIGGRHISEWASTPCHDTIKKAVWPDGSNERV